MKKGIIIFLIFVCLSSYGQTNKDNKNINKVSKDVFIGDSTIAILPYNSLHELDKTYLFGKSKETNLTKTDIEEIEEILNKCIEEYNLKQEKYYNENKEELNKYNIKKERLMINLKKYKRQYIAIINNKGEKKVYINCFCVDFKRNWRKELVEVCDGGNCFFQLRINIKTKKYYSFNVNGDA